jgi:hypothetical protein
VSQPHASPSPRPPPSGEAPATLDGLCALGRAFADDPSLTVEVNDAPDRWHFEHRMRRIGVGCDYARIAPDEARALVGHEAAHAALSRYHTLLGETLRAPGVARLFNALEDGRIERWLVEAFPGVAPWLARVNARLIVEPSASLEGSPWTEQFNLGTIYHACTGAFPARVAPEVRAALEATLGAQQQSLAARPPQEVAGLEALADAYEGSEAAAPWRDADRLAAPDARERAVRVAAWRSSQAILAGVLPVYEALVARDQRVCPAAFARLERRALHVLPGPAGDAATPGDVDAPRVRRPGRRRRDPDWNGRPHEDYPTALGAVAPLVERTVRALARVLRRDAHPRWMPGYASGARPHLPAAMRLAHDVRALSELWQRRTLPTRFDPAFALLLDLSGSMSGPSIEHAFRATVLLCEVLARLGVRFAVHGFREERRSFKALNAPLDAAARARIAQMPAAVGGSNHDAPALRQTAHELSAVAATARVLVVMSDGQPSGPEPDSRAALHEAVADITRAGTVHLVGVGLGRSARHVARFYPDALAGVALDALPDALARTLARTLLGPSHPLAGVLV